MATFVALVALLGLCRAGTDLKCDNTTNHEVLECRDPCPPQRTCQNFRGPELPCVPPMGPCTNVCVCADGYARNKWGGTCVTLAQCDQCPGYNQYFSCDGPYSETCTGSCHCADGYERDANNVCVSTTPPVVTHPSPPPPPIVLPSQPVEGPQPVPSGPRNSELKCDNTTNHEVLECRDPCPPQRTCQNFRGPEPPCEPSMEPCTNVCVCDDGYARNKWGGTCVTLAQCDQCPGNNQYFSCDGPYSETCTGSCHCADGYERDANNVCVSTIPPPVVTHPSPPPPPIVLPSQPVEGPQPVPSGPRNKCGENEYFQCDADYCEDCVGHCYCYSGYTRDINNKCVYVDPATPPRDNPCPPTPEP